MKKTAKLFLSCLSLITLCGCGHHENSSSSSGHKTSVEVVSYDVGDHTSEPGSSKPDSSVKPSTPDSSVTPDSGSSSSSSSSAPEGGYQFQDDYDLTFPGTLNAETDTITAFADGVTPLEGQAAFSSLSTKEEGLTVSYSYDDSLFLSPATTFSLPLQSMSYAMSMASLPTDGEDPTANAASLLTDLGFASPSYQAASEQDTATIGSYFATKWIEKDGVSYPVVAVVPSATDSVDASAVLDLEIGESGDYEGVTRCADTLQTRLEDYLATLGSEASPLDYSKVKLWITGYSVSGAVSNVLGGRINNLIQHAVSGTTVGLAALSIDNVFDYTYATPCGIDASTKAALTQQHNIFNTILDTDFLPHYAFNSTEATSGSGWDFARYGYDYVIDTSSSTLQSEVEAKFDSYSFPDGYDYIPASTVPLMVLNSVDTSTITQDSIEDIISGNTTVDIFSKVEPEENISINGLYHNLIAALTDSTSGNGAGLTRNKSAKLYGVLKDGVEFYDSLTPEQKVALKNAVEEAVKAPSFATTFAMMLREIKKANKNPDTVTVYPVLEYPTTYSFLLNILKKANLDSTENVALLKKDLPYIMWTLNGFEQMMEGNNAVLLSTFLGNASSTLSSHYPEAMLAWTEVLASKQTSSIDESERE